MLLSSIKSNPDNPRLIKDDKFKKLLASIKDFPQMLPLRPIVVDVIRKRYENFIHNNK